MTQDQEIHFRIKKALMGRFWLFVQGSFYTLGIHILRVLMALGSLWSTKLQKGVKGRKHLFSNLEKKVKLLPANRTRYWFHCASLGEFEQGRPVIELLRKSKPEAQIFLSFFSPSGLEVRKNYAHVDFVFYLPIDTKVNAKQIVKLVQPDFFLLVKYEFWLNLISQLGKSNCKTILFSAIFRSEQWFFKPWLSIGQTTLSSFDQLFVQDSESAMLLERLKINSVQVSGDTRVDRVVEQAKQAKRLPKLEAFIGSTPNVLVAGSTWEPDEAILAALFHQDEYTNWKFIIAPHEIHPDHISNIQTRFKNQTIKYSELNAENNSSRIIILNTVGDLSAAYQFGSHAYIGGGFGSGIHNILEPLAFGMPIFFGPNFKKFREATQLIQLEAGFSVSNRKELHARIQTTLSPKEYQSIRQNGLRYLDSNKGASTQILDYVCTFD